MATDSGSAPRFAEVDRALETWRQGDCVLGEFWFVLRADTSFAITDAGQAAADAGSDLGEQEVPGLVVLSQTCDVVRSCAERHYVEVSPLVKVDPERLREIERGYRPAYAFLPLLADRALVADLDRVMTVEKPVVAKWERTPGWSTDMEARTFAAALSRKRARFAFPDDFTAFVKNLQSRMIGKHEKASLEGRALRALREVRVQASPDWGANEVTLTFWFVRRDEDVDFETNAWENLLGKWLKFVPEAGRFIKVHGQVATLDELTAADFVHSDPLDLDHLSSRED